MMLYKFYEMYYYNNLQEDVNQVVVKALQKSSAQPWDDAAPILEKAMEAIMEDELDEEEEEEEGTVDMNEYMKNVQAMQQQMMQNMQQMMQGNGMQNYLQ